MARSRSGPTGSRSSTSSSTASGAPVRTVRPIVQRDSSRSRPRKVSPFIELGTGGLKQFSGWVLDEWLGELQGREAAWRYREFMDNDPVAGGFLFMIEMLAQRVTYSVEGGEPRWRKHIEQCMHDMSHGWDDFICEALTHLGYGYCLPPGELVLDAVGRPCPIEGIVPGDEVLTAKGRARRVAHTFKRNFSGDLVKLRVLGYPDPVRMTGEHRLPTGRGWMRADELKVGDQLLRPRLPLRDGGDYLSGWLVGLYLAEGSRDPAPRSRVTFSLHAREADHVAGRLTAWIDQEGLESHHHRAKLAPCVSIWDNSSRVALSHPALRALIDRWAIGERAGTKAIAQLPTDARFARGLWDGWLYGDAGYSISRTLVSQMAMVGAALGLSSPMGSRPYDSLLPRGYHARGTAFRVGSDESQPYAQRKVTGRTRRTALLESRARRMRDAAHTYERIGQELGVTTHTAWNWINTDGHYVGDAMRSRNARHCEVVDGFVRHPIVNVEREPYEGTVYDLEVEEDHTFCAGLFAVSNSFHEEVFKYRRGEQPGQEDMAPEDETPSTEEPQHPASSIYEDGLVGWRKLPLRAQETTLHWDFDGYSSLRGLEQLDWHGGRHSIPITKGVLIRNRRVRNNPEGYSILRRAWTSFFRMRGLQDIEAIGAARDLAGIPSAKPPPGVDLFADDNKELYNEIVELVTTVHRDEDEGLVWPTAEWEFELVSSSGSRQFDIDKIIRRYEQRIAASVAADFMLLGQDGLGSYAMVDVKSELFGMAVDGMIQQILKPMNRYAIPRLLKLNGVKTTDPPKIVATTAGRIDLEKVGLFLSSLAAAGLTMPDDPKFKKQLFEAAGLGTDFTFPPAPAKPAEPVKPATPEPSKLQKADGDVIDVSDALATRGRVLAGQLDREVAGRLQELGARAASTYLATVGDSELPTSKREMRSVTAQVVRSLGIAAWVQQRLMPLLSNHAARVAQDTERTLVNETGLDLTIGDGDVKRIQGSRKLTARDIEPQVRVAVLKAVERGVAAGEASQETADAIRKAVPAGRFRVAGAGYRSQLIGSHETTEMQRQATLAAYEAHPQVNALQVRGGDQDGEIVPLDAAPVPSHVGQVLSYNPVLEGGAQ